ncbi:MAG: flagellar hook-associated protein FlgK [Desulfobacteraceae bacterium]
MPNIFGLMNIGQSALFTQQKAIDITGNNIANVNTPGYSRQRLVIKQGSPVRVDSLTISTGVTSEPGIQRFYDQFLSAQLGNENESLGRWQAQKEALEKAELMFDEAGGMGLSSAMSEYWNGWQALSNNPSGVAERTTLISAGQYLSSVFNQTYNNISKLQQDIDTHVDGLVDKINGLTQQIADLNQKVTQVETNGQKANDFRDERDQLVFELSKLININSYEDGDGNLGIDTENGKPLVQGTSTWDLLTADNGGVQDVYWQDSSGTNVNITSNISSGELKGWIETRDVHLNNYLTQLDNLANTLRTSVNGAHNAGFDLNGNAGLDFFTGTGAVDLSVNAAIVADTDLIAAAGAGEGLPGGNAAAMTIANLQNSATMPGGSTFDEYYNALVGTVGADVQAADFSSGHQESMVQGLENYRQQVSGVSLDEEMVNLVKFQHAYNAAAKLITTADEMLDEILALAR